jgi:hypothetical protein
MRNSFKGNYVNSQLTTFGVTLFNASPTPPFLSAFKLATDYNFLPQESDTDVHGAVVGPVGGIPSAPEIVNGNLVKYSVYLDFSVGDFDFGNIGLFLGNNLVSLSASTTPIPKIAGGISGNSLRVDIYLSMVGTNYEMWADLAESNNRFQVARLSSPDLMPPAKDSTPNMYVIAGADTTQSSILAYTDRESLWNFDAYQFSSVLSAPIVGFDSTSVTIATADFSDDINPAYLGQVILQFTTGTLYSICRYVSHAIQNGSTVTLVFVTALTETPIVNDKFQVFRRNAGSVETPLPIATATTLGGIKIGTGLVVTPDGLCSIDPSLLGTVTSVNGQTGTVTVNATNLPGLSAVGKSGLYSDLIGAPPAYVLPPMSTSVRGGARIGPSGNLTIFGIDQLDLSFQPVKSVNGNLPDGNGLVTVALNDIGLVNPQALPTTVNLDAYTTTGLFTVSAAIAPSLVNAPTTNDAATLEVVPLSVTGTGDSIQRWTTATAQYWRKSTSGTWGAWNQAAALNIATTSTLGVVKIGSGLAIAVDGTLTNAYNLPVATTSLLGGVRVGVGLTVDSFGTISTTNILPIATATVLGGIKVGSGLAVTTDGTLSVSLPIASITTLGVIKVGSGLAIAGDGTLSANSTLPTASASTLGGIKIGPGLSIDSNGVVTASTTYTLPIASASILGGIKIGSGLSIAGDGTVSASSTYNLPIASSVVLGGVKVGSGLSVAGDGTLSTSVDPNNKLNVISGTAQGLMLKVNAMGVVSSAINGSMTTANVQSATFTGGAVTWTLSGFVANSYGEIEFFLTNAGLATHTFPSAVHWVNPDGTTTTSFTTYIGNLRSGATNFQTSGIDFVIFWSIDGGTNIYAKVL